MWYTYSIFLSPKIRKQKNNQLIYISSFVLLQQTSGGSGMRGPLHCPRIDRDLTGTLYVPEGVHKSVAVRGMNFPQVLFGKSVPRDFVIKYVLAKYSSTVKQVIVLPTLKN